MPELLKVEKGYTDHEFMEFTESDLHTKYELINGRIYALSAPVTRHGRLNKYIANKFESYFIGKKCEVFSHQTSVHLDRDASSNINVYIPDLFVICDKSKIKKKGVYGAPDLVVEIISPSNARDDYILKQRNYAKYGVREYWIIDTDVISLYILNEKCNYEIYNYDYEQVESKIFPGLAVDFSEFEDEYAE